jgi:aminoglycoside phosphotransferase family enzyme/predicted kinase
MDITLSNELKQAGYELIETHISRVFLRGSDVYKTKRSVSLGFLDFSSLAQRRAACVAELELNRRLAPDVYLGLVGLVRDRSQALCFEASERCADLQVLEWAVHMRRLREEDRADTLLERGHLTAADVVALAERIAEFHRGARSDAETARLGGYHALAQNVRENFAQLAQLVEPLRAEELDSLRTYQLTQLEARREQLVRREHSGYVRDGHGDLRLEHCYRQPDGTFVIIDCIEFNERFRFADVCADLAFLSMDLRHHGREDLAGLLIATYARESRDYELYALLDLYESYRATVRGKVSAMLAGDVEVQADVRDRAAHEARRYLLQALAASGRPLKTPTVIVVFGLIASGKSTVARELGQRMGAPVLCSDEIRKQLLGVSPETAQHAAAFSGAYDAHMTQRVYDTMLARATPVLASGRSVVLDASFRARGQRDQARALAAARGAEVLFVECQVERAQALARLAERAHRPHVSDGRVEIYDDFVARFEPTEELPSSEHMTLDTTAPLEATLSRIMRAVDVGASLVLSSSGPLVP